MSRRKWLVVYLVLALLFLAWRRYHERYGETLRITFFDVLQGDSALVEFPRGKRMLIDAGGGFKQMNMGSRTIFPELARKGVLRLDAAVLTHPDQDHGYGFHGVFEHLEVAELWFHHWLPKPLLADLMRLAVSKGTRLRPFPVGETQAWSGAQVEVIPLGKLGSPTNDQPLVLSIRFAGCHALFTADIEAEGEQELGKRLGGRSVTILKVPHHGSRTSSSARLLRAVSPRFAVASLGIGNRYGHPHAEVMERYRDLGVPVFRTDFHGFTELTITPQGELSCRTAHGPCGVSSCN